MRKSGGVRTLFATNILWHDFGLQNSELNKLIIQELNLMRERGNNEATLRTFNYYGGNSSWQSIAGLEKVSKGFDILRVSLEEAALSLILHSGYLLIPQRLDCLVLEDLWGNIIFEKGGYSAPHIHGRGNTLWTGVYYPMDNNTPDLRKDIDIDHIIEYNSTSSLKSTDSGGDLILYDPAKDIKGQVSFEGMSTISQGREAKVTPTESLLLLFPAYLSHMVTPTLTDKVRYSISFSVNLKSKHIEEI